LVRDNSFFPRQRRLGCQSLPQIFLNIYKIVSEIILSWLTYLSKCVTVNVLNLLQTTMIKEKKSFLQGLFQSKFVLVFEVLVLVLISAALTKEMVRRYQIHSEIERLQEEVASLEKSNNDLNSLIAQLNSESYKEEQARLKLGLQKPGESVVVVLGESTDGSSSFSGQTVAALQPINDTSEKISNPQRWWNYFFSETKDITTS